MLGRRRRKITIADADAHGASTWSILRTDRGGRPFMIRINLGLAKARDRKDFAVAITATATANDTIDNGFPTSAEGHALQALESRLLEVVGDDAVLAFVVTGGGTREFHLYSRG